MTRKDCERIAKAINNSLPMHGTDGSNDFSSGRWLQARDVAEQLAEMLAADNPDFNEGRFLRACGVKS